MHVFHFCLIARTVVVILQMIGYTTHEEEVPNEIGTKSEQILGL